VAIRSYDGRRRRAELEPRVGGSLRP
jgi:hypothetical protein